MPDLRSHLCVHSTRLIGQYRMVGLLCVLIHECKIQNPFIVVCVGVHISPGLLHAVRAHPVAATTGPVQAGGQSGDGCISCRCVAIVVVNACMCDIMYNVLLHTCSCERLYPTPSGHYFGGEDVRAVPAQHFCSPPGLGSTHVSSCATGERT